jgi:hypothetical protein
VELDMQKRWIRPENIEFSSQWHAQQCCPEGIGCPLVGVELRREMGWR